MTRTAAVDIAQASQDYDWSVDDTIAVDVAEISGHAIDHLRLTDPQRQWLSMRDRYALWRGGNSIGKSWAQAADIVMTARRRHEYRPTPTSPVLLMVVGYSWAQMDPLLDKLWALLPRDEIDPAVRYEPANGIRGKKEPVVEFFAGPGRGSQIRFATYEQGAGRIMGIQVHGLYLDEPPPADVYGECVPRLNAHNGHMRITFTPTPESPDIEYLRKLVKDGMIAELQTSITPAAVTVRGGICDWPRMSPKEIERALAQYLDEQRPMREHGAWDPIPTGRWITTFSEENISSVAPTPGAWVCISIDHGLNAGKQAAVLSWWQDRDSVAPSGGFLDEATSDGTTTTEQDAEAILAMLARNGMSYDDVDGWIGDRETGENRLMVNKSNQRLVDALARKLGRRADQMRRIVTPHKQQGSVRDGASLLRNGFGARRGDGRPIVFVHPRCARFVAALRTFRGGKQEPVKDIFDAGRYGMEHALREAGRPENLWRGVIQ